MRYLYHMSNIYKIYIIQVYIKSCYIDIFVGLSERLCIYMYVHVYVKFVYLYICMCVVIISNKGKTETEYVNTNIP